VISVVVLQSSMELLNDGLGSCNKTRVTSTLAGNEVIGIEAEKVTHITEEEDQEPTTFPAIKTEPNVICVPVVSVTHISCRLYPELPAPMSALPGQMHIGLQQTLCARSSVTGLQEPCSLTKFPYGL